MSILEGFRKQSVCAVYIQATSTRLILQLLV